MNNGKVVVCYDKDGAKYAVLFSDNNWKEFARIARETCEFRAVELCNQDECDFDFDEFGIWIRQ